MTRVSTARINEAIGLQIGMVQAAARKLNLDSELQEIEADIASLEKGIAELKETLRSIAHSAI